VVITERNRAFMGPGNPERGPPLNERDIDVVPSTEQLFCYVVTVLMGERQAARLFGWSLGGVFLVILALNAMTR
jgi:hypothetical protein